MLFCWLTLHTHIINTHTQKEIENTRREEDEVQVEEG